MDPITVQVVFNHLQSTAEEMWAAVVRASYSVNIKERYDCSAAIYNSRGEVIAMPSRATVPIHLSSLDGVVTAVLHRFPREHMQPDDMFIANDPYIPGGGGSHLPDYTVVAPIFGRSGTVVAFVANLGHHSDIGGAAAGSHALHMPTIFHEGLRLPPVRVIRAGEVQEDIVDLIALNSRLPHERMGDLRAQFAANRVGVRGVLEACERFGEEVVAASMDEILDYSERRLKATLLQLPDGTFEEIDYFDDDGVHDEPLRIQVRATKRGDSLVFDFAGTCPQVGTAINVPMVGTRATVFCVVKTLLDPELPPNAGVNRVVKISAPAGTLVNSVTPAAVGDRGTTCQVIGDVVAAALARLVPHESSAGCGSLLSYRVCGTDPRKGRYFVEYQAFGGGHGATAFADGMDSVRTWASGASNAPVEADEIAYPIIVHRYELRSGSGGAGKYRGGLGIVRVFTVHGEATTISTGGTRMRIPPPGIFGGKDGQRAVIVINPGTKREQTLARMVTDYPLSPGDVVEVRSSGGGGWGHPRERDAELVRRDLQEDKIFIEQVKEDVTD
jgi:N-methylhydantoinase B